MSQGFPDNESIKAFNQSITDEFRSNDGKVGGQFEGADRQPRVSPLAYFRIDGKLVVIGSYAGADVHPAWVHNLRAHPSAHIEVGNDSSDVVARELTPAERDDLFPKITAVAAGFAEYQAKTSRVIPVFELRPSS